jgi:hypothetical protein
MLTVLTQTPPFGKGPPPIAVATYAGARQKLRRVVCIGLLCMMS